MDSKVYLFKDRPTASFHNCEHYHPYLPVLCAALVLVRSDRCLSPSTDLFTRNERERTADR